MSAWLYLTSALYHAVPWRPEAKARMQRFDHAMIFLAIAGLVTAVGLLGLEGIPRIAILAMAWTIAGTGTVRKLLGTARDERAMVKLQVALALMAIPTFPGFIERFPGPPTILLAVSAISFSLGAYCFVTRSPRLWPRVFSFHEVFHVCTLVGSGAHCTLLVRYLW